MSTKSILVIGATGAQGLAVIDALLAPSTDGSPLPYAVRALTRDPKSRRAQSLKAKGVELAQCNTDDLDSVEAALKGVYGAWVNVDSFTVGEMKEMWSGMRIFELAKKLGVTHYVWSSLEYITKLGGYDEKYRTDHYNAKGRVADWMKAQPSIVSDTDMSWSSVSTGPYMDTLVEVFAPTQRPDGTFVFAAPLGSGHVPLIALADIGFFARYTFDNRDLTSAKDLEIASEVIGWDDLVKTFEKVTGLKAVYKRLDINEWLDLFLDPDQPVAADRVKGDGTTTFRQNFTGWWNIYKDDILQKDMSWIRAVHPNGYTVERWMRENNYRGEFKGVLKRKEDAKGPMFNPEKLTAI
ncbi:NAD-P-binding protein [Stereum hirsutum FP-91666 SS1]|uniref:NAD-P-binding protein n=1 Tax=Stereum hirsutum (strain FP-91666) TaxID=721885 RepID=UPI000444A6A8|nr:NAD-P-binding protein [Stereum hirsutum FP-91666 SS1]EIM84014.1 NAD-P-binding protein [Stereum hirsutum FP-91666 SS1]